MTDWATVSALATGVGTLVLAAATFASVRSANRSARITERSLLAGIRPLIVPSRLGDPPEKVGFADQHFVQVPGGEAVAEVADDAIYLAVALRNVGAGMAVLDRWEVTPDLQYVADSHYGDTDAYRRLTRDLYIAPGDRGFWQGALRDRDDPAYVAAKAAIEERRGMTVDLLYGDLEGGQRTITRIAFVPIGDDRWLASISRHWNLDREDPR